MTRETVPAPYELPIFGELSRALVLFVLQRIHAVGRISFVLAFGKIQETHPRSVNVERIEPAIGGARFIHAAAQVVRKKPARARALNQNQQSRTYVELYEGLRLSAQVDLVRCEPLGERFARLTRGPHQPQEIPVRHGDAQIATAIAAARTSERYRGVANAGN